jgi:hypothetical protein
MCIANRSAETNTRISPKPIDHPEIESTPRPTVANPI